MKNIANDLFTLKNFFFTSGLVSGIFLGVHLRNRGFSSAISRLYHISKENDYSHMKNIQKPHASIDDIYSYFHTGMFQDKAKFEKFKEITYSHKFNQKEMDDLIDRDPFKILEDPEFADFKSKFNAYDYQKHWNKQKN